MSTIIAVSVSGLPPLPVVPALLFSCPAPALFPAASLSSAPHTQLCKFKTLSTTCCCLVPCVLCVCVCLLYVYACLSLSCACLPYKFKQCWKHAALALFNHAPHTHTRTAQTHTHTLQTSHAHTHTHTDAGWLRQAFCAVSSQKCCSPQTIYIHSRSCLSV